MRQDRLLLALSVLWLLCVGQFCSAGEGESPGAPVWGLGGGRFDTLSTDAAWCGPRAAYALCLAEGVNVGLPALTAWSDCDEQGYTTLAGVKGALESAGLHTLAVRTDAARLLETGLRAVLLFHPPQREPEAAPPEDTGHAVAYLGRAKGSFIIVDPRGLPMRHLLSEEELRSRWRGEAILVSGQPIPRRATWLPYLLYGLSGGAVALAAVALSLGAIRFVRRRRGGIRRWAGAVAAGAALVAVGVGLGLALTRDGGGRDKAQQLPGVLTCEPEQVDFGAFVPDRLPLEFRFEITNVSRVPVIIRKAERSCPCLEVEFTPCTLAPGETLAVPGKLRTTDLPAVGPFHYAVALFGAAQGGMGALQEFHLVGTSLAMPECEPAELVLKRQGADGRVSGTFRVCQSGYGEHPGTPGKLHVSSALEGLAWELLRAEHFARDGERWADVYLVDVAGQPAADARGELEIEIEGDRELTCTLPVRITSERPFVVTPPQVVLTAERHGRAVSIRRTDGAPFRILSAASRDGTVRLAFDGEPAAAHELRVEYAAEAAPGASAPLLFDEVTAEVCADGGAACEVTIPVCIVGG